MRIVIARRRFEGKAFAGFILWAWLGAVICPASFAQTAPVGECGFQPQLLSIDWPFREEATRLLARPALFDAEPDRVALDVKWYGSKLPAVENGGPTPQLQMKWSPRGERWTEWRNKNGQWEGAATEWLADGALKEQERPVSSPPSEGVEGAWPPIQLKPEGGAETLAVWVRRYEGMGGGSAVQWKSAGERWEMWGCENDVWLGYEMDWRPDGDLLYRALRKGGAPDGDASLWHASGGPAQEGRFKEAAPAGKWVLKNESGAVLEVKMFPE